MEPFESYKTELLPNHPPVAKAGPDQTVLVTAPLSTAEVTLDSSGSYDPDGDPLTYTWTWDGDTAHGVSPTVELPLEITTITLVVNDGEMDSEPDSVDITVEQTKEIETSFLALPTMGIAPLKVRFADESAGEIDSWLWDFGDGKTSSEQNPSHTYMHAGRYTVSLTGSNPDGEHTEEKANYITVLPMEVPPEPASFSASYLYISPPQVLPNQQVEVSINIANHGGETGSHTVALYTNGNLEDSRTVGVSPGSTQNVVFRVTKATPGTYKVLLEGQRGSSL